MKGVSIIICTYNGKKKLGKTLEHVISLESSQEWELIVVDNASTDNTYEFVHEILLKASISFQLLQCSTPGKMNAFWLGVTAAKYSYILDCDDDNHLSKDYLDNAARILDLNPVVGALGGTGIPVTTGELPEWFKKYGKSYAIGPQGPNGRLAKKQYLYGAGTFFRREGLLELRARGFANVLSCRKGNLLSSGGDTELCIALELLGYQIWYSSSLKFGHEIPPDRLTWEYYLKLKTGIASSFPLLEAYEFRNFQSKESFKKHLFELLWLAFKGLIKSSFLFLIRKDKDMQIAFYTCKTKLSCYSKNLTETFSAYERNKQLFR